MYYKKLKECLVKNYFNVVPDKIEPYQHSKPFDGSTYNIDFCFNTEEFPISGFFSLSIKDKKKSVFELTTDDYLTESNLKKAFSFFKIYDFKEIIKETLDFQANFPDWHLGAYSITFEIKHSEKTYHQLRKMIFSQSLKEYFLDKKSIIISDNIANSVYDYFADSFFNTFIEPSDFYDSLNLNYFKFESKKDFITCVVYRINETEYLEYLELNYGR